MKEQEIAMICLEDGGRTIIHVMQAASEVAKSEGMDSPLKLPEGMLSSQDLDVRLMASRTIRK